jgi:hypothetical protein
MGALLVPVVRVCVWSLLVPVVRLVFLFTAHVQQICTPVQ